MEYITAELCSEDLLIITRQNCIYFTASLMQVREEQLGPGNSVSVACCVVLCCVVLCSVVLCETVLIAGIVVRNANILRPTVTDRARITRV